MSDSPIVGVLLGCGVGLIWGSLLEVGTPIPAEHVGGAVLLLGVAIDVYLNRQEVADDGC